MSREKFRELILEICNCSNGQDFCGAVKLNKLLFFIDLYSYAYFGKTISGQKYQKFTYGPVAMQMLPMLKDMEDRGDIQRNKEALRFGGTSYTQTRTVPNRKADLSKFTTEELDLVKKVVEKFKDFNGSAISELSHKFIGWELAQDNEIIPLETVFISNRELSTAEKLHAEDLMKLPEYEEFTCLEQ